MNSVPSFLSYHNSSSIFLPCNLGQGVHMRFAFQYANRTLLILTVGLLFLPVGGCETTSSVISEGEIPETNLFPLATGRIWVFTAYQLDTTNSQKISSTVHREVSSVQGVTTVQGKTAFRMIDSTYTPSGTVETVDTSYLAIENGDLYQWSSDQPTWMVFFKKSEGLNKEYVAGQFQEIHDGVPVSVTFKGKIYPKESVSAPIGSFQAYKVELKVSAVAGPTSFEFVAMQLYVADGVGPVKMVNPVVRNPGSGLKEEGEESLLVSKNF